MSFEVRLFFLSIEERHKFGVEKLIIGRLELKVWNLNLAFFFGDILWDYGKNENKASQYQTDLKLPFWYAPIKD